jgi:aryl-alcohol dehydrogenase-like predicted oxidoreductase
VISMKSRFGSTPTATLGQTGVEVSRLGLGGEGPVLRSTGRCDEAVALIRKALELGITYFDTARAYAHSEVYLGRALVSERERVFIASKTAQRSKRDALRDLHRSLRSLRTDRLDLWQLHDLRRQDQWHEICRPGGALEALEEARSAGKVRFTGITAHKNPTLFKEAICSYSFDAVMLPVNILEPHLPGFLHETLLTVRDQRVALIGMFVMVQGLLPRLGIPPEILIRWALTQPVATLAISCETPLQVEQNVHSVIRGPLLPDEAAGVVNLVAPYARELAFYRSDTGEHFKPAANTI